MLCERCKMREANIRYTEVVNGVKTEHNLCSQCAQEMDLGPYAAIFDGEFSLSKLLSGILGMGTEDNGEEEEKLDQIVCPTCKTTYGDFIRYSKFGCPDCYELFDPLIREKIKKLQGSDTHTGKKPKYQTGTSSDSGKEKELTASVMSDDEKEELLQSRLKEAIRDEEYELAAQYRDQIKALKERGKTDE